MEVESSCGSSTDTNVLPEEDAQLEHMETEEGKRREGAMKEHTEADVDDKTSSQESSCKTREMEVESSSTATNVLPGEGAQAQLQHTETEEGKRRERAVKEQTEVDDKTSSQESSFYCPLDEDFHASFEEIQKNRQVVRAELDKMREVEEIELKKFTKLKRLSPGSRMFPDLKVSGFHTIAFKVQV